MQLKSIAEVVSGYSFRGAIKPDQSGSDLVLQAKDIPESAIIDETVELTPINLGELNYRTRLEIDDIIIASRGLKSGLFRAAVFKSSLTNVIPSSSVHVIRIKNPDISPKYVAYLLNSEYGQQLLSKIVSGSYIGAIPRRLLEELDIPIPSTEKQYAIVNLQRNIRNQQQIQDRKAQLKQQILETTFKNILTK